MMGDILQGLATLAILGGIIYATFFAGFWMVGIAALVVGIIGAAASNARERRIWQDLERMRRAGNS